MKKAYIIYERYYDFDAGRIVSGGVQTYISNLIPLLIENGYQIGVYQFGIKERTINLPNCSVIVVPNSMKNGHFNTTTILDYIEKQFNDNEDLLLFADHILVAKNAAKRSISIQHGIHWDIPKDVERNVYRMFLSKARFAFNEHKRMGCVKKVICVDYNFVNWYRTQVDQINTNLEVIPNFTKIAPLYKKPQGNIQIIFARRFVKHRGTRVFAETAKREETSRI